MSIGKLHLGNLALPEALRCKIGASMMNRLALAIGVAAVALAQQAPRRIVSPEVLPDRRITFRVSAPKASEALVRFSEGGPQSHAMTKGEDGVWSVTIGPVEPEIYTYSFLI